MSENWSEGFDFSSDSSDDEHHHTHLFSPSAREIDEILSNLSPRRLGTCSNEFTRSAPQIPFPTVESSESPSTVLETTSAKSQRRGHRKYINQYLLVKSIGKGAFGSVSVAKDVTDNQKYAIKIINKSILKRKRKLRRGQKPTNMLENVFREIAIMKKLDHPNVVKLIEVIDDPLSDKMFLVLELVERGAVAGGTAQIDPIDDLEMIRRYFRDMILGVDYLHQQNILHSDIKPANLLLGQDGHIKLADFGVSTAIEVDPEDGSFVGKVQGTPAFLAPEVAEGGKFTAFGIDVWAMGVTLFMFITGICPFAGETTFETYEKIVEHDPPIPSDVDPRLQDVLRRILTKDPSQRITLSQLMAHPWVTNNGRDPLRQPSGSNVQIEVNDEEVADAVHIMKLVANVVKSVKRNFGQILPKRKSAKRLRQVFSRRSREKTVSGSPRAELENMEIEEDGDDVDDMEVRRTLRLDEAFSEPICLTSSLSSSTSATLSVFSPSATPEISRSESCSPPAHSHSRLRSMPRTKRGWVQALESVQAQPEIPRRRERRKESFDDGFVYLEPQSSRPFVRRSLSVPDGPTDI